MRRWKQVKWTEAGQVAAILGWPESECAAEAPEVFFDRLVRDGRTDDAALFLGQALPRFEAVAWAARAVRDLSAADVPEPDAKALKAALLWLQDPSETRRRAAFDAATEAGGVSPQRLCAMAVFFSGGSMAPAEREPLLPPKDTAGTFAAGAVLTAVARSPGREKSLREALALGDALASGREGVRP
jgi:hypothetical protein